MTRPQPQWLDWARKLQAIAQNGLTYAQDPFDIERYEQTRAIAVEILATHSNLDNGQARAVFANGIGYQTPKIGVRGAIIQNDAILLVKERATGLWTLPGGFVDVNESPSEAIEKEVWEESGFQVQAVKLLAVFDPQKHGMALHPNHIYRLFFRCEIVSGEATPGLETEAVDFFSEDDLPELCPYRNTAVQIKRMFDHYRHPEWPTDFD